MTKVKEPFQVDEVRITVILHEHVTTVIARVDMSTDDIKDDITGIGVSKRNPADRYNEQVGYEIALARALKALASHVSKRANSSLHAFEKAERKRLKALETSKMADALASAIDVVNDIAEALPDPAAEHLKVWLAGMNSDPITTDNGDVYPGAKQYIHVSNNGQSMDTTRVVPRMPSQASQ